MPCNWSIAANVFRNFAQSMHIQNYSIILARPASPILNHKLFSRHFATVLSPAPSPPRVVDTTITTDEAAVSHPLLTEAQISRAACNAIHKCLRYHSLGDAYYVLNSLRYSNFLHSKSLTKFKGVRSLDDFRSVAIKFGRPTSPRLPSHALLHGLLRIGLTKKAYNLTQLMIKDSIRVRSKTLEAVMQGFCPPGPINFIPARSIRSTNGRDIFKPEVKLVQGEGTRMALSLLSLAQKSRHQRTRSMYAALLALCIINGEIILGSLLFGYMIRDCQNRMAAKSETGQTALTSDTSGVAAYEGAKLHYALPVRERAQISCMLQSLLQGINSNLEHVNEGEEYEESVQAALQALALLANLLDQRQLPIAKISSLICTLYSVPKLENRVWILDTKGKYQQKRAYEYFHDVLKRAIKGLSPKALCGYDSHRILPRSFDLRSCNALLHYSLRHRLSPTLCNNVLHHMLDEGRPQLKPDIVTYNTLIRSGTILRDSRIVEQMLAVLRRNPENHILAAVPADELTRPDPAPAKWTKAVSKGDVDCSWTGSVGFDDIPEIDDTTLCSYIAYLTAIGQPGKAAKIIVHLIPELRIRLPKVPDNTRKELQQAVIQKAVALGPHIFAAILNALEKAGKTRLAERLWFVAVAAERASHDPKSRRNSWVLPIHAYTIMMTGYAKEMRREMRRQCQVMGQVKSLTASSRDLARMLYERAIIRCDGSTPSTWLDPRFFNAALDAFGRDSRMRRRVHLSRNYKRRLAAAQWRYSRYGVRPIFSSSMLDRVGSDMVDARYEIPATYQHLLVGHLSPVFLQRRSVLARPREYQPFACPPHPLRPTAPSIPTCKQRGSPLRRGHRPSAITRYVRNHPDTDKSRRATDK
ncbi:hypothetical protein AX17_004942 [Amanita inopinata Kibby_2008]|nr:hypothetical protein AX17_004942 [Amanita inopinata Kibby_2008]